MIGTILSILFALASQAHPGLADDCNSKFPERLRFSKLEEKIRRCGARSVEDILQYLTPQQSKNYVLAYDSRSLQEASFENPRVLLHDGPVEFVMAFNGHPSQRGYDALETMQFDEQSREFQFRQIKFGRSGKVEISELNPRLCQGCHGKNPHPIWDEYLLWPGFYGSEDDQSGQAPAQENQKFKEFLDNRASHPRYRFLGNHREDGVRGRPNELFGIGLHRGNFLRLGTAMAKDPRILPYKDAVLGALACADYPVDRFLSPEATAGFKRTYSESAAASEKAAAEFFLRTIERQQTFFSEAPVNYRVRATYEASKAGKGQLLNPAITSLLYLLNEIAPGLIDEFSLPLGMVTRVGLSDGIDGHQDVAKAFMEELGGEEFEPLLRVGRNGIHYVPIYRFGLYDFKWRSGGESKGCQQLLKN
jgi:hypothetical protein